MNTVYLVKKLPEFGYPDEKINDKEKWVKHIYCESARFHVLSWSGKGAHCSTPNCIINRPIIRTE